MLNTLKRNHAVGTNWNTLKLNTLKTSGFLMFSGGIEIGK